MSTVVDPFRYLKVANPQSATKTTPAAPKGANAKPDPVNSTQHTCCPCHRSTSRPSLSIKPILKKFWRHRTVKKVRTILVTAFATLGVSATAYAILMAALS